jgi:hypothetical protein
VLLQVVDVSLRHHAALGERGREGGKDGREGGTLC